MRHIDLNTLLPLIFAKDSGKILKQRLDRADNKLANRIKPPDRAEHTKNNGPNKWGPIKRKMTAHLGNKCWYTEVEIVGAPLVMDHYRPVCEYWWLAYDAENYRVACSWANSPEHNFTHGCAGGKGDSFPLLAPGIRATGKRNLHIEYPVILDPCNDTDCALLAFDTEGHPVVNPAFAGDAVSVRRVEESKLLLNLDHPEFNSKREQLYQQIAHEVMTHEELPLGAPAKTRIHSRLRAMLLPKAPFSTAARFYLKLHRHLNWVEDILNAS